MAATVIDQTAQQDALRPLRQFVGQLNGFLATDNVYAGADGYAINLPGGYQIIGPGGIATEGKPITLATDPPPTGTTGAAMPSNMILMGLAVLAVLVILH